MDLGLTGKTGLVTGGSRGIGRAIALRLAAEVAQVGICGAALAGADLRLSERASWINGANITVDGAQGRPSAF